MKTLDLFAGVGGLTLGFASAGFDVVASVDNDPIHKTTHRVNFPDTDFKLIDLSACSASAFGLAGPIDVVVGGPPCQGFSVGGLRKPDDPRNALLLSFARLVGELRPRYFVMENVPGLVVVPTQIVDKLRALWLGLGLSTLRTEGGLSCSIVRPS